MKTLTEERKEFLRKMLENPNSPISRSIVGADVVKLVEDLLSANEEVGRLGALVEINERKLTKYRATIAESEDLARALKAGIRNRTAWFAFLCFLFSLVFWFCVGGHVN